MHSISLCPYNWNIYVEWPLIDFYFQEIDAWLNLWCICQSNRRSLCDAAQMNLLNWLGSENSEKMCHNLSKMSAGESCDASDTIRTPSDKYKEPLIVQESEFVCMFFSFATRSQSWPYGASKPTGANLASVLRPEHREIAFKTEGGERDRIYRETCRRKWYSHVFTREIKKRKSKYSHKYVLKCLHQHASMVGHWR